MLLTDSYGLCLTSLKKCINMENSLAKASHLVEPFTKKRKKNKFRKKSPILKRRKNNKLKKKHFPKQKSRKKF